MPGSRRSTRGVAGLHNAGDQQRQEAVHRGRLQRVPEVAARQARQGRCAADRRVAVVSFRSADLPHPRAHRGRGERGARADPRRQDVHRGRAEDLDRRLRPSGGCSGAFTEPVRPCLPGGGPKATFDSRPRRSRRSSATTSSLACHWDPALASNQQIAQTVQDGLRRSTSACRSSTCGSTLATGRGAHDTENARPTSSIRRPCRKHQREGLSTPRVTVVGLGPAVPSHPPAAMGTDHVRRHRAASGGCATPRRRSRPRCAR